MALDYNINLLTESVCVPDDFRLTAKVCVSFVNMKQREMVLSQLLELGSMFDDMKERLCYAEGNRYYGFLGSQACFETKILVPVI